MLRSATTSSKSYIIIIILFSLRAFVDSAHLLAGFWEDETGLFVTLQRVQRDRIIANQQRLYLSGDVDSEPDSSRSTSRYTK